MTINMMNGWLNKITGSHDNLIGDSFLPLLDTKAASSLFFFATFLTGFAKTCFRHLKYLTIAIGSFGSCCYLFYFTTNSISNSSFKTLIPNDFEKENLLLLLTCQF